jgi:metallo-beta-lactamase family protein
LIKQEQIIENIKLLAASKPDIDVLWLYGSRARSQAYNNNSVLIDCGLFQDKQQNTEKDTGGRIQDYLLSINFDIKTVLALIVTHCHIDHVGRIPYLLAAGFREPIFATTATAALLTPIIEDTLKVGVTRNKLIINACLKLLKN